MVCYEDAGRAGLGGEVPHLRTSVEERREAVVAQAEMLGTVSSGGGRAADRHAETLETVRISEHRYSNRQTYGLKGGDGLLLKVIPRKVVLCVVDSDAAGGTSRKSSVVDNRYALVRSVGGMLEVHDGGPVVGEVLSHLAGRAAAPRTNIPGLGGIELVSTNDVVKMRGGGYARLDDRVKALDGQGRASKAKTCVDRRDERGSDGERLHVCG